MMPPRVRLLSTALVLVFAGCADDEPTAPAAEQLRTSLPNLAQTARSARAKQLEPIKDRISGSAYAFFFGRKPKRQRSGLDLGAALNGRGRASPGDFADVLVNNRSQLGLGQSEVVVADHGGTIVMAWNDAAGFYEFEQGITGWGMSPDGGRTFVDGGAVPRIPSPGFIHIGDPGLAVGNNGTFFLSDVCLDFAVSPLFNGICVTTGRRQGRTIDWHTPVYAVTEPADFLDKPFIAADRKGRSVYVSYTLFQFVDGQFVGQPIEVVASHDGGQSFGPPVIVGPFIGLGQQWSEPAVGPAGEVYVAWSRETSPGSATADIMISKSTDGGGTFSSPLAIQTFIPVFAPPSGYNRDFIIDPPRIDVARSGPNRGEVYVVYHAGDRGTADVYLTHSPNGVTWSDPVLVNDDLTDYQFWPVVAVEPSGNVDVAWYDRRLNPGTSITNVFWSQSTDGGQTFRPNVRVSDAGSDWAAAETDIIPNFGDYIDISAGGNRSYAGWGDGRLGDPDVFFSELRGVGKAPSLAVAP